VVARDAEHPAGAVSLVGLIAQFVNPELERFAAANGRGVNIVDDRFGFRPAGSEAPGSRADFWIKTAPWR
jgi:hypothetical protein